MKLSYLKDNKMGKLFEKATVFPLETAIEYTAGGVVSKQIIKSLAGNITLFSFDEGQGLTEHTAQFDAMIQILDGEAKIQIDGKSFTVKKGESIILPAGHPHALQADIDIKPRRGLLICTNLLSTNMLQLCRKYSHSVAISL